MLARGDRRLGRVILAAWKRGAKFDAWQEWFDFGRWLDAFRDCELDPAFYVYRTRPLDEVFHRLRVSTPNALGLQ